MPFLDNATPTGLSPQRLEPVQVDVPTPPLGTVFRTAFERENTIGSAVVSAAEPAMASPDPRFDPFKQIQGYEDYAAAFIDANSEDDVSRIKARIDKERRRTEILDAAGGWGFIADLAAGVADPVNFIPVGGVAVRATRLGRIGAGTLQVGAAGLVSGTASEILLQGTQLTRTEQESALNIAASTLLSGVLGAAAGGFGRGVTEEAAREALRGAGVYERELTGNLDPANDTGRLRSAAAAVPGERPDPLPRAPEDSSVGAAAARATSLEDESFSSALGTEKALAFSSPTLRLGNSPSVEVRRLAQELAEQPLEMRKNLEGVPSPIAVETRIRLWQVPLAEALTSLDDAFVQYRLGRERQTGDIFGIGARDLISREAGVLTRNEFNEAVSMAMRRGDTSDIPEVAKAAKAFRPRVFEPLKERAVAATQLPEDVDVATADSYLMRVYDPIKITARRGEFTQRITRWLLDEQDKKRTLQGRAIRLLEERNKLVAENKKLASQIERRSKALDKVEAKREEASRLNAFAFRRAEKLSRPADELRASLAAAEARIAPHLENLSRVSEKLTEQKEQIPGVERLQKAAKRLAEASTFGVGSEAASVEAFAKFSKAIERAKTAVKREINAAVSKELKAPDLKSYADELAALEAERKAVGGQVRPYRKELARIRKSLASERGAKAGQAREGAVFETEVRGRGNALADQASGRKAELDAMQAKVSDAESRIERIREALEEVVLAWEGKTSKQAKGALKRRGQKETARGPEKGRLKEADKTVLKAVEAMSKAKTNLDALDLQDTSRQIIDRILGTPAGRLPYDVEAPSPKGWAKEDTEAKRGPLAGRVFMIPDAMIEDFLENDISVIARMYTRTMAADVELAAKFGRADMEDQIKSILEHYEILRQGKDEKGLTDAGKTMNADIRDLTAIRDRLRGTYALPENPNGLWERAWRVVRDVNYLRLLGGMTISALPDMGRTVMVHGLSRVFGDGLVPMLRDFERFKMAAGETKLAGTALDMVLDSRAMALADVLDDYGRWSKFERGLQAATSKFGLVTLMAPWNAALKQFVGVVSQTRTLQAIEKLSSGGAVKEAERTRLAQLGIGPSEIRSIQAMVAKHGSEENGIRWANTGAWEDREAADIFHSALSKEVNAAIVTPGQEKPLWMSKGIGRVVGQFRSFAMSSTQRTMIAGLQKRDMATLNGAVIMTTLGMMSYWIKAQMGGQGDKVPDPTTGPGLAKWLSEGVDKSGLTGWMFDAHNTVEKFTRGAVGLSRLTGQPVMSRYASRNAVDTVLGPTAGFISDVAKATGALGSGEWVASDTHAMRRMLPFQNLIGFRHLFDEAEEGINQALGIPERRSVTRH